MKYSSKHQSMCDVRLIKFDMLNNISFQRERIPTNRRETDVTPDVANVDGQT